MGRAIVGPIHFDNAFRQLECRLQRVVQAPAIFAAHDQTVDDDRDVVIHPPIQTRRVRDLDQLAIDDRAHETLFARGIEQLAELAFATAHQRR